MFICIALNKQVFRGARSYKQMSFELLANVSMESDEVRSSTGSLFHVAGPDTAKLRRPMVVQESRAVARELRDVAAVVFILKFAYNIHYKLRVAKLRKPGFRAPNVLAQNS